MKAIPLIWSADIIVDRGPVDDPILTHFEGDASCDSIEDLCPVTFEGQVIEFMAGNMDEDPAAVTVVALSWSAGSADLRWPQDA